VKVSNPKGKKKKPGLPVLIEGVSGGAGFDATLGNCPATLPAGASCSLDVTFTPMSKGKQHTTLSVDDNADGDPQHIQLKGSGK